LSGFDVLTRGEVLDTALKARDHLISSGIPAALANKDARPWSSLPVDQGRLGWLELPAASHDLLAQMESLVAEVRYSGLDHIVLVGLGADGLAAQAIMDAGGGRDPRGGLTLLDGGDFAVLDQALERLDRTLVVLSSKGGDTIEGDAYRRVLVQAFRRHGLSEPEIAARFLVLTDHGTPLDEFARHRGYRLGLTDPELPGHFGALSAYGLVPAVLAGTDVVPLLEQATSALSSLSSEEDNPGLLLGAVLGGCAQQPADGVTRDKLVLREAPGGSAMSAWVSQLLATGTGKRGRGILPLDAAGLPGADVCADLHAVAINPQSPAATDADTSLWAPAGAQFMLWEYATAVAGWLMGVNPFETAAEVIKEAESDAAGMLRHAGHGPLPTGQPSFVDGEIEAYTEPEGFVSYDLASAVGSLLRRVPDNGYLSILTYLSGDFSGRYLAPALARRIGRPVTYGSGPGYLHSTGSYHKDGPRNGAFLIITGAPLADRPVPGRPYTLGKLQLARALADVRTLRRRGIPVLRLHLRDPIDGAGRLIDIARETR
jgi:glucose-6-phosphate isomerase